MHADQLVFEKTSRGLAEVAKRSIRLSLSARAMLIMMDGRSSVGELRARVPGHNFDDDLRLLQAHDLLAPKASAAAASGPRPGGRKSVALAKLSLLSVMERALPHQDHPIRETLRAATSREEVLGAFAHCRAILLEISGADDAGSIERQLSAVMPGE